MKKMKFDSAEVKFTLVPHGYQIDVVAYGVGRKKPIVQQSVCRDFSGDDGKAALLFLLDLADDFKDKVELHTALVLDEEHRKALKRKKK
jgi:hypothetical protein